MGGAEWLVTATVQCGIIVGGGPRRRPLPGQVQGGVAGVFSFMAAASWAFCNLYFWIFR